MHVDLVKFEEIKSTFLHRKIDGVAEQDLQSALRKLDNVAMS